MENIIKHEVLRDSNYLIHLIKRTKDYERKNELWGHFPEDSR